MLKMAVDRMVEKHQYRIPESTLDFMRGFLRKINIKDMKYRTVAFRGQQYTPTELHFRNGKVQLISAGTLTDFISGEYVGDRIFPLGASQSPRFIKELLQSWITSTYPRGSSKVTEDGISYHESARDFEPFNYMPGMYHLPSLNRLYNMPEMLQFQANQNLLTAATPDFFRLLNRISGSQ